MLRAHLLLPLLPLALLACRTAPPSPAPSKQPSPPAAGEAPSPEQACRETACRPPRTVTLLLDEEREMRQELPPFPYVYRDVVYVEPGDDFRVTGDLERGEDGDRLVRLRVVEEGETPPHALHLRFAQEVESRASHMMMLSVESALPRTLRYDLSMLPAGGGGWRRTRSCPVPPGKAVFETWPQPLRTLVLSDLRFVAEGEAPRCE
jgi:hypothetical protein